MDRQKRSFSKCVFMVPTDKSIAQITEFGNVSRDKSFRWLRVDGRRLRVNASTDAEISMRYRQLDKDKKVISIITISKFCAPVRIFPVTVRSTKALISVHSTKFSHVVRSLFCFLTVCEGKKNNKEGKNIHRTVKYEHSTIHQFYKSSKEKCFVGTRYEVN